MIEELTPSYSLQEVCQAIDVSRSGYYEWRKRQEKPSKRKEENQRIVEQMRKMHQKAWSVYGSPKMTEALRNQGHKINHKRVARLMKSAGLKGKRKRPFRPQTTRKSPENPVAPNRLKALAVVERINQAWAGDITYIATQEGWLFLAAVMDLYSRHIVGWRLGETLETELVLAAQEQALWKRKIEPGLISHSDRGCQYTSQTYQQLLKRHEIQSSMSAQGNCYDNAAMESFWSLLKAEALPESGVFESKEQARLVIFEYIEIFYNRQRLHSALGYKSPVDFEKGLK